MRAHFLIGAALFITTNAFAATDPDAEQLAFISIFDCPGAGIASEGGPPGCSASVLLNADGTGPMLPLPGGPVAWSPDGRRLLLERGGDIHVTAATGGPTVNLTNHAAFDWSPAWSADGTRIAFASDRDGSPDLYVMNSDGSGVVRLHTGVGMAWGPTWSPDSARLAFNCILGPLSDPWWYTSTSTSDVCTIGADGSAFAQVTSEQGADVDPAWSPDGTRILFSTARSGGQDLATVNPDGSGFLQITQGMYASDAGWSSDGSRIAFVWTDSDMSWGWNYVALANADGTNINVLAFGHSPVWKPWTGAVNERPAASFTFECLEQTCTFDASASSDSDGSIASYGWYFGDGATAVGASVSHSFAAGFGYSVQLVIMDDKTAMASASRVVDLNQPPIVSFTAKCTELACTFDASASYDPDGSIELLVWRFGDGFDGSGPFTMSHTYAAPGIYTVTLTATDRGGASVSYTQTITATSSNALPIASFTWVCRERDCTLDASGSSDPDGTISNYAWDFGDNTGGSGLTVSHSYPTFGTFPVRLIVTDNGGLKSARYETINVVPAPTLHVGDLDGTSSLQQSSWTAIVTIAVHNSNHGPLANARVAGRWLDTGDDVACITNADGRCTVTRMRIRKMTTSVGFSLSSVTLEGFVSAPAEHHDPDGDSNGRWIAIARP